MLASFVRFLDENELIDFGHVLEDTDEGFETRFRIQKYVYLAEKFGLENPYNYSIYRYGPYSSSLASDYYQLGENLNEYNDHSQEPLPDTFDRERFLGVVNEKDNNWLEISTTLIDQNNRFTNDDVLVDHVERIKCDYSNAYIRDVLTELHNEEIL